MADGVNFRNSRHPFWSVKRGRNGALKGMVNNINEGDILWFLTNGKYGGKFIGMSEYICSYDIEDEPLISVNTIPNEEQNWVGNEDWPIQMYYTNLYNIEDADFKACFRGASPILKYETYKNRIPHDLYITYNIIKRLREPKPF